MKDEQKEMRDYSKDVVPEKKYLEHCFSDEYPSSDEEQENMKAPTSFFIKKPPSRDSDDETSDVSGRIHKEILFF